MHLIIAFEGASQIMHLTFTARVVPSNSIPVSIKLPRSHTVSLVKSKDVGFDEATASDSGKTDTGLM